MTSLKRLVLKKMVKWSLLILVGLGAWSFGYLNGTRDLRTYRNALWLSHTPTHTGHLTSN